MSSGMGEWEVTRKLGDDTCLLVFNAKDKGTARAMIKFFLTFGKPESVCGKNPGITRSMWTTALTSS